MAAASAAESRGGTSRPLTRLRRPPDCPHAGRDNGIPAAMDSSKVLEWPSLKDGSTEMAASDNRLGTSPRNR